MQTANTVIGQKNATHQRTMHYRRNNKNDRRKMEVKNQLKEEAQLKYLIISISINSKAKIVKDQFNANKRKEIDTNIRAGNMKKTIIQKKLARQAQNKESTHNRRRKI